MSDSESQQSGVSNNKGATGNMKHKAADNERAVTAASSRDGKNPFIIPEDKLCEMIFTFKDDEK